MAIGHEREVDIEGFQREKRQEPRQQGDLTWPAARPSRIRPTISAAANRSKAGRSQRVFLLPVKKGVEEIATVLKQVDAL
jgi:hypothetical protein